MKSLSIAIVGNPNSGKTTLFNALTGSRQHVGNWPGVTVEKIEGSFEHEGTRLDLVDLPGIYSFSAYSIDESIAREHILKTKPDLVVNIVDATNLERNLFLTTQLIEIRTPMVVALNMMDLAAKRRIEIEIEHLARHLDCPVIPVVAARGKGIAELRDVIHKAALEGKIPSAHVAYDSEMEKAIARVCSAVGTVAEERDVNPRWLAIKLLEGDELGVRLAGASSVMAVVSRESERVSKHVGDNVEIVIADGRYGFIHGLARDVVHRKSAIRRTISDNIDKALLSRVLGIPVFLGVMYLVFVITINVSAPFTDFLRLLCGTVFVDGFAHGLASINTPAWLITLLASGFGGGIRTVATFLPPIFLIFLCLAFLEDSGYMARAAFVMDRFLRVIGLPGKAFIPMLVGFGCNVPAIMAARTLESRRDRTLTIMINPFMSCGARLPIYTLFIAAFFPERGGPILFGLYLTGVLLAVGTGLLFKSTILSGEAGSFVMELPPYHLPTVRGVFYHSWIRLKSFMIRAGKVILCAALVLSLFNSIGSRNDPTSGDSRDPILAVAAKRLVPIFRPMGISEENWPAVVGLFTGVLAKESVVGTLDALYAQLDRPRPKSGGAERSAEPFDFRAGIVEAFEAIPAGFEGFIGKIRDPLGLWSHAAAANIDGSVKEVRANTGTVLSMTQRFDGRIGAISYLLFILIYSPCIAVIAVTYRETSLGWATFSVFYTTILAWLIATIVYQTGTFVLHPGSSAFWLAISGAMVAGILIALKMKAHTIKSHKDPGSPIVHN